MKKLIDTPKGGAKAGGRVAKRLLLAVVLMAVATSFSGCIVVDHEGHHHWHHWHHHYD